MYIIKFSQDDFALNSKLWPTGFFQHRPIFACNSRSTDLPTSGKQNTVKTAPQPLFVNRAFVFHVTLVKKIRWPAADSILMPPTFPIARLNRYTPNFSGLPQNLTWCQQFGLQIFPKWGDADIFRLEMAVFRCFFGRNKFSRPNGRLSPIACHTDLESYGT